MGLTLAAAVFAWAVPIGICTSSARADYLHFSSLDMTPVRISLVNKVVGKADFPDLVVPRAYIFFVNGFPPSEGPLPSQLSSNDVNLMFVDGTGEAWTVATADRARRDGIDPATAGHRMRAEETIVQISPSKISSVAYADAMRDDVPRSAPKRQDDDFDGLAHYRGVSSFSYYVGGSDDEFFSARCQEALNPVFQCLYTMSITEGVVGSATFVDFRLYGGRAYANRRLRFAREVACRYLTRC
ncbi:hypothetical protein [Bradyrhizobium sp. AUGA SZCCT0431]|uniref:hypothetical protein n=1 Tax=Bradyrhizobium sp. AUGA SZCCT0431 TaxID=2807674 RepID=UPI001BACD034|nr:hypothetical protein [Bradyrhizobium sp. AUGA SZCCT0431]MBR1148443.1 hypothetical protein [Bradyrhizobium sp. AUGA SZCCT0431]